MKKGAKEPWEQQPGESGPAFEAFTVFRNLGPGRVTKTVSKKLHKSYTLIRKWKDRWNWQERASAWDVFIDESVVKEAQEKYEKKMSDSINRQMGIALQLEKRALEELNKLESGTFSPKDVKEYFKLGTELERISLELEKSRLAESNNAEYTGGLAEDIIAAFDEDGDADD